MSKYSVPGISVAIAKNGQLLYAEGFGYANKDTREKTTTHHLFRVASISKPFTAVAPGAFAIYKIIYSQVIGFS